MCCSTVNPTVDSSSTDKREVETSVEGQQRELIPAPCPHNKWTRARRLRQGGVLLRCQECMATWPTRMELHEKCPEFYAGSCTKGGDCPRPHIYARGALAKKGDERETSEEGEMVSLRALKDMRKKALRKKNRHQEMIEGSSTFGSSDSSCGLSNDDMNSNSDAAIVYRYEPYSVESVVYLY